jgi:biopolymer transport protein ExbD
MNKLKKITLSCLLVLGLTSAALANNPASSRANAKSISKKIEASVSLPKALRTPGFSQKVKVFFTVDEKGNVTYGAAATKNAELKKSIETQFKQICFAELNPNTAYNVEIKFIVQ